MAKKTKFMERLFSAMKNEEVELQKQVNDDIDIAAEKGECDTEDYCIKKMSDNEFEIHDKVNDEDTIAKIKDDETIELTAKECDTKTMCDMTEEEVDKEIESTETRLLQLKEQKAKFNKEFSDSEWYIVTKDGKTIFTGTANECRAEWNEKGYKMPDYLVTPVTMEEKKPETRKKTFSEKIVKCSDENPTPNQEGADYELKQWIEDHPGQAKYIAELGAKWGTDKILEGLEHDMNEGKEES